MGMGWKAKGMSVIKVYFNKRNSCELIAEFRSECLLGLCKSAIMQEAELRNVRVSYQQQRVVEIPSKFNEDEEKTKIVGKS